MVWENMALKSAEQFKTISEIIKRKMKVCKPTKFAVTSLSHSTEQPHFLDTSDPYSAIHLISTMIRRERVKRPPAKCLKYHPLFWDADYKLKFVKVISYL